MAAGLRGEERELADRVEYQVKQAESGHNEARLAAQRVDMAQLVIVVLGLVAMVALGTTITRGIVRALGAEPGELAAVAERTARGDLAADGRPPARPGSVMASMQAMRESLVRVVSEVRSGVDNVATASSQIAQGNQDLSGRTESQASSLQQTAASVEQSAAAAASLRMQAARLAEAVAMFRLQAA